MFLKNNSNCIYNYTIYIDTYYVFNFNNYYKSRDWIS